MRKALLLLVTLALFTPVNAQQLEAGVVSPGAVTADFSTWGRLSKDGKEFSPALWEMTYVGDELCEVRDNFDYNEAVSVFYGHRLKKDFGSVKLAVTPGLGFIKYGPGSNIGILAHASLETDKWKLYALNQYTGAASHEAFAIAYHFTDFEVHAGKYMLLGVSDQYYEMGIYSNFDAGPSLGFHFGKYYAKAYAWDPWSDTDRYYGVWFGVHLPR